MAVAIETLAEEMYKMVVECQGKKNLKALDLTKAMIAKHGEAECSKDDCKHAIRQLMDSGPLRVQLFRRKLYHASAQGRRCARIEGAGVMVRLARREKPAEKEPL